MDKMINSARFFYTGSKVARGILNAAAWICGVVAVLVWILPGSAFLSSTETLTFGPLSLVMHPGEMADLSLVRLKLSGMLAVCTIVLAFVCRVLRVICEILEPMQEGRPFGDDVAPRMKKLAWLCLIGGGIAEIAKMLIVGMTLGGRDLMQYFNPALVQSVELQLELNLWFVGAFILLMLMSHIFAYGQQLQQLSDETL